ncbi:MAG: hypothetical protein HQ591_13215 [candidate division Zixibacteria bacterium]|nr:hypothetical protein [Candidatus Tariuqbacter arcticus]
MNNIICCAWCLNHPLRVEYHDCEWGVPLQDVSAPRGGVYYFGEFWYVVCVCYSVVSRIPTNKLVGY